MSTATLTRIVLASRLKGHSVPSDLRLETAAIADVRDGELLGHNLYLSIDPYFRTVMGAGPGEPDPMAIDEQM